MTGSVKTQIIALDNQEDYLSVRDKLNWSQTGRVMLTWPANAPILTRLDLVLIQRHAAARGVQLALISQNGEIREVARELQLPVFESTKQAHAARWRLAARAGTARKLKRALKTPRLSPAELQALRQAAHPARPEWLGKPALRWAGFGVAMLAFLALLSYVLPSASLSLTPETRPQTLSLEIAAGPDIPQVNLAGRLPTYPVNVIVEARGSLPATGSVPVPFKTAQGGIQFTNLTEEALDIPVGTVVSTLDSPAVRFATSQAAQVPAGKENSVIVNATALVPGASGNLPAESLVAIEGPLGLKLSASNLYPTHGGADGQVRGPSKADRDALLAQMAAELEKGAQDEMQASLSAGDLALKPSLTYLQTLEETFTPEPGQPGELLELTLRLEFTGQAISYSDLQALVTPAMDADLPEGFTPQVGSLQVRIASTPRLNEQGELAFTITAQRSLQADIPAGRVVALILGQTTTQASQSLADALPLASPPHIEISPGWWPRLPLATFRIRVNTGTLQ
jgi:hypothetical protein